MFTSNREALEVLNDKDESRLLREEAAWYLEHHAEDDTSRPVVHQLVDALRDDDLGVRWAATEALTKIGFSVLPELISALTDPKCAGDARLREGARRILAHLAQQPDAPPVVRAMLRALRGPASDLEAMREAGHWLRERAKGG